MGNFKDGARWKLCVLGWGPSEHNKTMGDSTSSHSFGQTKRAESPTCKKRTSLVPLPFERMIAHSVSSGRNDNFFFSDKEETVAGLHVVGVLDGLDPGGWFVAGWELIT